MINTMKCPECQRQFQHESALVLKRMVGVHRRAAHNIPGRSRYIPVAERRGATQHKLEYQRQYRERQKLARTQQNSQAIPCRLDSCPVCGSRFYVMKGQNV